MKITHIDVLKHGQSSPRSKYFFDRLCARLLDLPMARRESARASSTSGLSTRHCPPAAEEVKSRGRGEIHREEKVGSKCVRRAAAHLSRCNTRGWRKFGSKARDCGYIALKLNKMTWAWLVLSCSHPISEDTTTQSGANEVRFLKRADTHVCGLRIIVATEAQRRHWASAKTQLPPDMLGMEKTTAPQLFPKWDQERDWWNWAVIPRRRIIH